jgi:hypothetical protein
VRDRPAIRNIAVEQIQPALIIPTGKRKGHKQG